MTKFESEVTSVPSPQQRVFDRLSDLDFLERLKDSLPEKAREFSVRDHCLFLKTPMGEVSLKVVETEPAKMIKYGSVTSPVPFNLWIQILPVSSLESKMRITAGLEMPSMLSGMVSKPLKSALDKMAQALSQIPY